MKEKFNERQYYIKVELKWDNLVEAESMVEAIENIKSIFEQEHNLDLDDSEIISVELVNNDKGGK